MIKPTTDGRNSANLRTALVFASIAAAFFFGIIAAHAIGGPVIGVGVMGAVVLLFLGFAIGRNLRASDGDDRRGRLREQGEAEERSSRLRAGAAADHEVQRTQYDRAEAASKGVSPSDRGGESVDSIETSSSPQRPHP